MPTEQQSALCCLSLLAMAKLAKSTPYSQATNEWVRIHDIIAFISDHYGVAYAENSRETFRKRAMHAFRTAALIEDNGKATNSPNYRYRITSEFLAVIQNMSGSKRVLCDDNAYLTQFIANHESLTEIYASKKQMHKLPVRINNQDFTFSPGKHNQLQWRRLHIFVGQAQPTAKGYYRGICSEVCPKLRVFICW